MISGVCITYISVCTRRTDEHRMKTLGVGLWVNLFLCVKNFFVELLIVKGGN